MAVNWNVVVTTMVSGLLAAFVVYQVKDKTKGIVDGV